MKKYTKQDIIAAAADDLAAIGISTKAAQAAAIDAVLNGMVRVISMGTPGDRVELRNFGRFTVTERSGRMGRNPQTGEDIKIEPKTVVKFSPSEAIEKAMNTKK